MNEIGERRLPAATELRNTLRIATWNVFHARRRNIRLRGPTDSVAATAQHYCVRQFVQRSADELGTALRFEGQGKDERGVIESVSGDKAPAVKPGHVLMRIDPRYSRPPKSRRCSATPSRPARSSAGCPRFMRARCASRQSRTL